MAIISESAAQQAFGPARNFGGFHGAFGANDSYCDGKYPPTSTNPQVKTWNAKCKKSCSGFKCVSNPGLLAAPWTVVGKNARGLPDDSLLGSAMSIASSVGGKTPTPTVKKPTAGTGNIFGNTSTLILLGSFGLIGAALYMKRKGIGTKRLSFSGYSKKNRRTRRQSRHSKRRG